MHSDHATTLPLDDFLTYMPDVGRCQAALRDLNGTWRLIEASATMNCPQEARLLLPAVIATRTNMMQMEEELVANLVSEKVRRVLAEAATRAQYALDLLVRNLFERTADVGFLAADADLCRFAAGIGGDAGAACARLAAYRAKYTVYEEVLVLAPDGRVLAQAGAQPPCERSADPLLARTLACDGFLESFGPTDLRPGQDRALLYAQTMRHPESGQPVGVLCLSFRFEHEMDAIFAAYRDSGQRANMLLLDGAGRVLSSADPLWMPIGASMPMNPDASARILMFAGREYLAATCASQGYQGYPGPQGWRCQVMVPLDLAFRGAPAAAFAQVEPHLLRGLLSHAHTFNPALHSLLSSVNEATHAIKRIVWNGKVTSAGDGGTNAGGKLGAVLDQITETGERSDAVFSRSIRDLYQTVLASSMLAAEFTSQLLVDMLDRSLYERANDCRWWALAGQLRDGLAAAPARHEEIGAVLRHINGLYTVYSRLFVYDRNGSIVAATGSQDVIGTRIATDTLAAVCGLRGEHEHHVEPFAASPLYDGRPTFVYHAAIRHPEREATIAGGIGIVFDGEAELRNMLDSGVAGRPDMQAFYVTPEGRVLCGTDPSLPAGSRLPLDCGVLDAAMDAHGASVSRIAAYRGQYCVAACTAASGYREFRTGAHREEAVLAVLLQSFGALREETEPASAGATARIRSLSEGGRDYAVFHAAGSLMALPAAQVLEALPFAQVKKTPAGAGARIGMLDVDLPGRPRSFLWVFDLSRLLSGKDGARGGTGQVLLLKHGGNAIGLLVDDVHSVQQFDPRDQTPLGLGGAEQSLFTGLIKANGGELLIQELSAERIFSQLCLRPGAQAA